MAAVAEPLLMTVEQYRELPQRDDVVQELRWGQVITLTRPKMRHTKLQYRLVELLRSRVEHKGIVASEIPFRALPQYELRGADVAFVSHERWTAAADDDNLQGSPELVIEILSPSNTQAEMREKATLYLSTGCQEFWIVNPKRSEVTITRREGGTIVYDLEKQIPLSLFDGELSVSEIFS
jgi:Uma2 family endonuclease